MRAIFPLIGALAVFWAASAGAQETTKAQAQLKTTDGKTIGTAQLLQTAAGVLITVETSSLPKGAHGFHIHTTGKCEGPDFKSAGGHFNPGKKQHGFLNDKGPHAGDVPNLWDTGGSTKVSMINEAITLGNGANSVFDQDGAALVIHAGPDDYTTDPAGNSGDRIACGVVEKVK